MTIENSKFMQGFIRLTHDAWLKGWHERNGGNLSYRIADEEIKPYLSELSPAKEWLPIKVTVPHLAGEYFLVTGTGRFMRNVILDPKSNIGIIKVSETGDKYAIVWGLENGGRPTSELPTHLLNHELKKLSTNGANRVIYHAHPANLIALTFVLPLTAKAITRALWQMASENPIVFPHGIGVVPWMVPGGSAIAEATAKLIDRYDMVLWAHHGIFTAGADFDAAFSNIDTAEKAAEIYIKVQSLGGIKQTMTLDNIKAIAHDFHIELAEEFLD